MRHLVHEDVHCSYSRMELKCERYTTPWRSWDTDGCKDNFFLVPYEEEHKMVRLLYPGIRTKTK